MTDLVKPELRRHLRRLQAQQRMWDDRRRPLDPARTGLPVDYLLAAGTDEGDAATAYRRDRYDVATEQIRATRDYLQLHYPSRSRS